MKKPGLLIVIALSYSARVFAGPISVGYLSLLSDSPTSGEQALTITNLTGPANCQASEYSACTNLNFTNWTLTVDYTSSYYSGTPFVFTDSGTGPYGGFGDITPGSTNNVFAFDLCGGQPACTNIDSPVTSITKIEFSGQISPSSFCLYDASASGCNVSSPTTFFANPDFDLVWDGNSPQSPYVNEDNNPYAQSPDIIVTSTAPEPGSFFLSTALIPLAWLARRSKSVV